MDIMVELLDDVAVNIDLGQGGARPTRSAPRGSGTGTGLNGELSG